METNLLIRPTIESDLSSINEILNDVILNHDHYLSNQTKTLSDTKRWFEGHQNSDRYTILSAEIEKKIVGWVSLSPFRNIDGYDVSAELSVYVHPDYYRREIGKQLMIAIEQFAQNGNRLHSIVSVITATNVPSIALHHRLGYTTAGVLKEIASKNGRLLDVVLMTKMINSI